MDTIKDRGLISTLSIMVQSPLDLFTEQEKKMFSNHAISSWNIVCKPFPLILFRYTTLDANALFAVFNYCNPASMGVSWETTISDI